MILKILGCISILAGSYSIGCILIYQENNQEKALAELHNCLQWMVCELRYQMPPLEALCRSAAEQGRGTIASVMLHFSDQLQQQQFVDPALCMQTALDTVNNVPKQALKRLYELGFSLGQFDLENQISSIELTAQHCRQDLEKIRNGIDQRRRNYQTFSLCAGAALSIIIL